MADLNTRTVPRTAHADTFHQRRGVIGVASTKPITSRRGHAGVAGEQSYQLLRLCVKRGFFDIAAAGRVRS